MRSTSARSSGCGACCEPREQPRGRRPGSHREPAQPELFADRIYALTPKGEVDRSAARRPRRLDFAYQVHTDLGHRCRGAKVNGRIVPLTITLANGEVVEIITGKHAAPSRDWLAPEQGYLASARSRTKVRAWFRRQDVGDNRSAGRAIAERELARVGARAEQLPALIAQLRGARRRRALPAAGRGRDHRHAAGAGGWPARRARRRHRGAARKPRPRCAARSSPVDIEGVGDLPITLARCCAPLRPQPIVGYVTVGRGVTIHRAIAQLSPACAP